MGHCRIRISFCVFQMIRLYVLVPDCKLSITDDEKWKSKPDCSQRMRAFSLAGSQQAARPNTQPGHCSVSQPWLCRDLNVCKRSLFFTCLKRLFAVSRSNIPHASLREQQHPKMTGTEPNNFYLGVSLHD